MDNFLNDSGIDINIMPYEKLLRYGVNTLTDTELLAAILRTGTGGMGVLELSELLISKAGSKGIGGLIDLEIDDLREIKGIGKVKAVQIKAILELSRRLAKLEASDKLDFSRPDTVAKFYMQDLRHLQQEHLILILLDSKCCLIKDMVLTVGTVNSALINPREIYIKALKAGAVFIMLMHNHPSGDPRPSKADIKVTREIYEAGKILGVNLIDHIIIGDNAYYSLKANGTF